MKVVLVHITIRIIAIIFLSIFFFILLFNDGSWSFVGLGLIFAFNMSFFVSAPYFFIEAYSLHQKKLKHKSRASLILGGLFLLTGLSFFFMLIDGLV